MRNRVFVLSMVVLCLALAGGMPVAAQEEGGEAAQMMKVSPVEIYGCMFKDGQGRAELAAAAEKFNAWMDETGQNDYFAWILWPHYRSVDQKADFLWAGGWPSGAVMGAGLERWLTEGGEVAAEFGKVAHCPNTINLAALFLTEPNREATGGAARFSNCTVEEGREFSDAMAAIRSWIAWEKEHGVSSEHTLLFPAYGEPRESDYDFKWVSTSSWTELGEGWDTYGNGGGWQKSRELFDGLLDCDVMRVYDSSRVRGIPMEE